MSEAQGQNCKIMPLLSEIGASRKDRKQGNLGELNLEALLEPCGLLLRGGSLNIFKEIINENFDTS